MPWSLEGHRRTRSADETNHLGVLRPLHVERRIELDRSAVETRVSRGQGRAGALGLSRESLQCRRIGLAYVRLALRLLRCANGFEKLGAERVP